MKWSTSFLSNFNVHVNHMLILKKCADSDSVRLEWGLRFCVSNKLLGDASIKFMNFTFSNKNILHRQQPYTKLLKVMAPASCTYVIY